MNSLQENIGGELHYVSSFEEEIERLGGGVLTDSAFSDARDALCSAICNICHLNGHYSGENIERVLGKIETASEGHRTAVLLLIRALSVEGLLQLEEPHSQIPRKIINLVETHTPEIKKQCRLERQQTFEKIHLIKAFHGRACDNLKILSGLPNELGGIGNQRDLILKALRQGQFQSYLQPFNYSIIKPRLEIICEKIYLLNSCVGAGYKEIFDDLCLLVSNTQDALRVYTSFLSRDFVKPFLASVSIALDNIKDTSSSQFKSVIEPLRNPPKAAAKRYPLHQEDKSLIISIPMINKGPSTAIDVRVEVDCGADNQSLIFDNEQLHLGDVPVGEFSISVRACVVSSSKLIKMTIQINWREVFDESDGTIFDVHVEGQDPDVDWSSLERLEPYSLEVAEGEMFVGRTVKVSAIGNKLLKKPMASTYITGQKRIGKTSLARAVLNYLEQQSSDFRTLYLEYGEYCSTSPEKTLKSLGENIYAFLHDSLPAADSFDPDFTESISALNQSARLLEKKHPQLRFIIVLDEFDEIHPEMYRIGPLAETFFANLRTLAAKNNLAFILVGGERMPFIIGAQGDQLNKFSREPLDFFSRVSEWNEYVELVTKPVEGKLNWDDAAINFLFTLTNGHPYYTKLLCSKIVSDATVERDTEIIVSDVEHGLSILLSELDTNSFAHMWKDGINAEREQAEVTELKRLRALVSIGRALRSKNPSISGVKDNIDRVRLQEHEVQPLIDDFLRRDILRERHGELYFTVPIFQRWLMDFGVSKLITSTYADELEAGIKEAEDQAFVKSGEIQELTDTWPLYKSQKISSEHVRAWLDQVGDFQDQRLLFKILQNIRFFSSAEIEEKFKDAHDRFVRPIIGAATMTRRTDKRSDVWISYVDGVGKSGAQCARDYAKINSISTTRIIEPANIFKRLSGKEVSQYDAPKAVIIIDDVVGTGKTLSDGLSDFTSTCGEFLERLNVPVLVVMLISTEEGERKIEKDNIFYNIKYHVCEYLSHDAYAFPNEDNGLWSSDEEKFRAKALCSKIGLRLYKSPLGYKDQGLLLVLPYTCPNNSLPILFKSSVDSPPWNALFLRPVT
ncbi:phosphoribosyltransferase-like protein [Pseudomonas gingeri]|uniref:ATP-binding protein n=1 Tax=Pseudomonas gingeri TaxID=117681 RepID=A0A7Y8CLS4_9PSED|nr:ATP-binding protein [Pseudomonas gingeri]NWB30512.1 ATP-binding protein [Pseudomonas gingeri]NWC35632.1 ATP-binding protein [Pseudomonas gingeri]